MGLILECKKQVQINDSVNHTKVGIMPNLCSSSWFLIGFSWGFHEFPMKKSLKSIRGVAKAEGPVPAIAGSCKWTYVLKQKKIAFR